MTHQLVPLRNLIEERTGLFFPDDQGLEIIAARLTPRLKPSGCQSFAEYYRLLSNEGRAAATEWLHVVAGLAKPKSSFLRHETLTQSLVNSIMPRLLLDRPAQRLRIWSAACSTGEEPLAIAMALSESGWLDRMHIDIYGSDASFVAIEKAERGVFSDMKVDYMAPALRTRYFMQVSEGWQVRPEIHKRIRWSVANLMNEGETAELASSDIICCRNVFIYFSEPAIRKTLRMFGKHMPSGGFLLTDAGDYFKSLMSQVGCFEQRDPGDETVWIKPVESAT